MEVKYSVIKKEILTYNAKHYEERNAFYALFNCKNTGYEPLTVPQVMQGFYVTLASQREESSFSVGTISLKATGLSAKGNKVVVYTHLSDHFFSKPDNVERALNDKVINGAGRMHQKTFQTLLDREDKEKVFVVDYNKPFFSGRHRIQEADIDSGKLQAALGGSEESSIFLSPAHRKKYFCEHSDHEAFSRGTGALWRFIRIGRDEVIESSIDQPYNFIVISEEDKATLVRMMEESVRLTQSLRFSFKKEIKTKRFKP